MEEGTFVESQSTPAVESVSSAPAAEVSATTEKMVQMPQSRLDEIIKARVAKERAKYEQPAPASSMGGMPTASNNPDEIRKVVSEIMSSERQVYEQKANESRALDVLNTYETKLNAGKANYADFDDVYKQLPLADIPHIIGLASTVDNTADVMYDLGNNPHKIGNLMQLAQLDFTAQQNGRQSNLARRELMRLAESLKTNQQAKAAKQANAPLSQLQPSPTGTDSGELSYKDLKRMYRG